MSAPPKWLGHARHATHAMPRTPGCFPFQDTKNRNVSLNGKLEKKYAGHVARPPSIHLRDSVNPPGWINFSLNIQYNIIIQSASFHYSFISWVCLIPCERGVSREFFSYSVSLANFPCRDPLLMTFDQVSIVMIIIIVFFRSCWEMAHLELRLDRPSVVMVARSFHDI